MKRLLIIALLCLLISSAFAEVEFYGSARLGYWYEMLDEDLAGGESRINMEFAQYSTSRMGAKFNLNRMLGKVEFGFNGTTVYTRLINGTIDFGAYKLLIGQDYSGFNLANAASQSTSILLGYENMLLGYGAAYDGRHPMIKLILKNGLYFSLSNPKKINPIIEVLDEDGNLILLDTDSIDALIPKINLSFNFKNEDLEIYPTIGFNMSQYNANFNVAEIDEKILAYVFATTFKYNLNNLVIKCQVHYGQNLADYGILTSTCANAGWDVVEEEIIDVVTMGGYLQMTYPIGSSKITAGGGYATSSSDNLDDNDTGMSVFLQGNFKLHEQLSIIPEAGMIDDMEDGKGKIEGSEIYFGIKLQMDF